MNIGNTKLELIFTDVQQSLILKFANISKYVKDQITFNFFFFKSVDYSIKVS